MRLSKKQSYAKKGGFGSRLFFIFSHGGDLHRAVSIDVHTRWLKPQPELFYRKTLIIGKNVISLQCENSHFHQ